MSKQDAGFNDMTAAGAWCRSIMSRKEQGFTRMPFLADCDAWVGGPTGRTFMWHETQFCLFHTGYPNER